MNTEQWKKHAIPGWRKAPDVIRGACAVMIESVMHLFGGRQDSLGQSSMNAVWKLNRTVDGCFVWSEIVTSDNLRAPSPRHNHTAWEYAGNLWVFGGFGPSPAGYLNDYGDYNYN